MARTGVTGADAALERRLAFDELDTDRRGLGNTPLWILAGQVGTIVGIGVGFGAFGGLAIKPNMVGALMILFAGATIGLGPVDHFKRLTVTMPALLFLAWWALSYLWTYQPWAYLRDTQMTFPLIGAMVIFATLLPYRRFTAALVAACHVCLGWAIGFTLLFPGQAMIHSDGNPGWPMSFGHKNGLAPFLIFTVLVVTAFEPRAGRRRATIALCIVFLLLSQSMTGLTTGLLLLLFARFVRSLSETPANRRGAILAGGAGLGLVLAWLMLVYLPTVVDALGKDLTLTSRTDIWAGVLEVIGRQPWIGYGKGGVWYSHTIEPTRTILDGLGFLVYESHNAYLEITLQLGLIGLGLWLVLLVSVVRSGIALLDIDLHLARFLIMFIALVMVFGVTETPAFGIWITLICAFGALGQRQLNLARRGRRRTPSGPPPALGARTRSR